MASSRVNFNFTFTFTFLQDNFDSPTPDFSRYRFVRAYTLGSRSFLCWVRNSAEVRISGCTRVFRTLLYYLSALFFVYYGVLCDLTLYFLMWRIWWSPNNTIRWQMGLNSAFNPWNTHLNPVCHLLVLLEAHHILHVSRIRVKGLSTYFNVP